MNKTDREFKMGTGMRKDLANSKDALFENLYIYVTNKCNMHCAHCYLGDRLVEREEMSPADVKAHLKFWKELGSSKICFLGGEPTQYPYLREVVDCAKTLEYSKIIINTNLSKAALNIIRGYSKNDFTYIQTSLDGASEEIHDSIRGKGAYKQTVESIAELTSKGYDIRIIMTVNNRNLSEMIPMVELSERLGASLIKFHIMSEIGNAEKGRNLGVSPKKWHEACEGLKKYLLQKKERKIKVSYQPAYSDFLSQDEYAKYGYQGCVGKLKERMSVFPDGKCYICSFLFDFKDSYAELNNGIIEINNNSVERNFNNTHCTTCTRCMFDGCIAEELIYGKKVCSADDLLPICRLWKVEL